MTDLKKLFGIDEQKNYALAQLIAEANKRHPGDRYHFASHLEVKLKNPKHKVCVPELEDLCVSVIQEFTPDQVRILINEIIPNEEEMKMLAFMAVLQNLITPSSDGRKTH